MLGALRRAAGQLLAGSVQQQAAALVHPPPAAAAALQQMRWRRSSAAGSSAADVEVRRFPTMRAYMCLCCQRWRHRLQSLNHLLAPHPSRLKTFSPSQSPSSSWRQRWWTTGCRQMCWQPTGQRWACSESLLTAWSTRPLAGPTRPPPSRRSPLGSGGGGQGTRALSNLPPSLLPLLPLAADSAALLLARPMQAALGEQLLGSSSTALCASPQPNPTQGPIPAGRGAARALAAENHRGQLRAAGSEPAWRAAAAHGPEPPLLL